MARRRNSAITSLRFNQDQGCFTCCLTTGLRVYNVDPLVEKTHYGVEELGEVSFCEMIHRTNWLFVVRAIRPCVLMLLDDEKRKFKAEVTFNSPIRGLRARRDKIAVVLSSSIQVLSIPTLQRVALLRTPASAKPLCEMATSVNATHQLLAAPAHRKGSLQLLDISKVIKGAHSTPPSVLSCHKGTLVCLSVSPSGSKVATASERGTLIRVWDTGNRSLLHELRRGSDYADVYCINFNTTGSLICCVSDKGTVHVWNTGKADKAGTHLGTALAKPDTRAICAFLDDHTTTVICENGTFHKFTYSMEGSCHRSDYEYFLQVGDDDDFIH